MKNCYLCQGTSHSKRPGKVRDDESLDILECDNCGLVTLSKTSVPKDFYEDSGMHGTDALDINDWLKQLERDDLRRIKYIGDSILNRDIADFGCGPGGFMLKARTKCKSITGIELETRLKQHYLDNGLEVVQNLKDIPTERKFDMITSFHVVEHLEDPAVMLNEMAAKLKNGGQILIEIPSATDALLTFYHNNAFSEFTYWSCHLFLFNASNLKLLAKKAGLTLNFVEHVQRYPLSNHLYWLANGRPGGHEKWFILDSDELTDAYSAKLASLGLTDTLMASFSKI